MRYEFGDNERASPGFPGKMMMSENRETSSLQWPMLR